jgi:hypothetical protein
MAFDGSVIAILWESLQQNQSTVNTKDRQAGGKTQTASPGNNAGGKGFSR